MSSIWPSNYILHAPPQTPPPQTPPMSKRSHSSVAIGPAVLGSFRPAKSLAYHDDASITSLDFDTTGQYLVSAGVDKSIQLYDVHKGVRHKDIQSQKYGAHVARFTNRNLNCLYASTPAVGDDADHSVRYLSLTSKAYLRYFKGHKDQVTALEVHPVADTFVTAARDHCVKHWDLRTPHATGNVATASAACVAYDPHGVVFAVGQQPHDTAAGTVALYDTAHYERGPFVSAVVPSAAPEAWTRMEFGNNGKHVLVVTDAARHYVLDAFLGAHVATLVVGPAGPWLGFDYVLAGSACFTPDGKWVLAGTPHGDVAVFDLAAAKTVGPDKVLRPYTTVAGGLGPSKLVAFNPKLLSFATADNRVILWEPADA